LNYHHKNVLLHILVPLSDILYIVLLHFHSLILPFVLQNHVYIQFHYPYLSADIHPR
jgi:hypothetical protein